MVPSSKSPFELHYLIGLLVMLYAIKIIGTCIINVESHLSANKQNDDKASVSAKWLTPSRRKHFIIIYVSIILQLIKTPLVIIF
jgi:hypothetical protein